MLDCTDFVFWNRRRRDISFFHCTTANATTPTLTHFPSNFGCVHDLVNSFQVRRERKRKREKEQFVTVFFAGILFLELINAVTFSVIFSLTKLFLNQFTVTSVIIFGGMVQCLCFFTLCVCSRMAQGCRIDECVSCSSLGVELVLAIRGAASTSRVKPSGGQVRYACWTWYRRKRRSVHPDSWTRRPR